MAVRKLKDRSDPELRTIALGVYAGKIITNAQANEQRWRHVLTRPPLIVEYQRLSGTEQAKVKRLISEIEAWEKGAKVVRPVHHALVQMSDNRPNVERRRADYPRTPGSSGG